MKIFMSHSSRQKLFVKELRRHLPASMALWIDEMELRLGADVESELQAAIMRDCDFFIIVVDGFSNESEWVSKEISWAIEREQQTGQTVLLPILVEPEAWESVDERIRQRKFLTLQDFTDENIAALGRSLTSEILDWLVKRLDSTKDRSSDKSTQRSNADLLKDANQLTQEMATTIKLRLLPYRRRNPVSLNDLRAEMAAKDDLQIESAEEMYQVLDRLNSMNLLNGIEYDDEYVFLSVESYSYKASLYIELKKKIARYVAADIESGTTIALDGGSSVQLVGSVIARRLRMGSLSDINIITNAVPVAHEILQEMSSLGVRDRDRQVRLYIVGGMCRATSLTTIPIEFASNAEFSEDQTYRYDKVLEHTGPIDIAFLGANGVYKDNGLGTHNRYETSVKQWMVARARKKYVLMDPSKFEIQQQVQFASFDDGLSIITAKVDGTEEQLKRFQTIVEASATSTLEVVE